MTGPSEGPRVVVLTRDGCHLCDIAIDDVRRIAGELDVDWVTQDIDADPELRLRWTDFVPVICVDGRVLDWFRVDEPRLRAALA